MLIESLSSGFVVTSLPEERLPPTFCWDLGEKIIPQRHRGGIKQGKGRLENQKSQSAEMSEASV